MNFEEFTKTLAADYRTESLDIHLCVTLYDVLRKHLETRPEPRPVHFDPVIDRLVERAWVNPRVMENITSDPRKKIQAIKDLREAEYARVGRQPGLKDCKDAVERICEHVDIDSLRKKLTG